MRIVVLLSALLLLASPLAGCRQASSAWTGARTGVSNAGCAVGGWLERIQPKPDPCAPTIVNQPVYGGGCSGDTWVGLPPTPAPELIER